MTNLLLPRCLRTLSRTLLVAFLCVSILVSGLMSAPARAQQILAAIVTADLPRYQKVYDTMAKVLQAGGFSDDKLKLFKQSPNADKMSLTNSLRRAEASGATLIVTYGSHATLIAKETI